MAKKPVKSKKTVAKKAIKKVIRVAATKPKRKKSAPLLELKGKDGTTKFSVHDNCIKSSGVKTYQYFGSYPIDLVKIDNKKLTPNERSKFEALEAERQKAEAARIAAQPHKLEFAKILTDYSTGLQVLVRATPLSEFCVLNGTETVVNITTICNKVLCTESVTFENPVIACEYVAAFGPSAANRFCQRSLKKSLPYLPDQNKLTASPDATSHKTS